MAISAAGLLSSHFLSSQPFSLLKASRSSLSFFSSSRRTRKSLRELDRSKDDNNSRSHGFCGTRMSSMELNTSFVIKKKAAEVFNELKGTSIFLIGMNCTMKTNLGNLLADALRYYYFDSDSVVEQAITDDSQERNEEVFRESETEVLKQLSAMGRLVVCTGDGAVLSTTNLALLRDGISLWIDVPLDMLADEELKDEVSPPNLETSADYDPLLKVEDLSARYSELKGGYATADATVSLQKVASQLGYEDYNSVSPEDMAVQALKEIERLTRLKKMVEEAARPF